MNKWFSDAIDEVFTFRNFVGSGIFFSILSFGLWAGILDNDWGSVVIALIATLVVMHGCDRLIRALEELAKARKRQLKQMRKERDELWESKYSLLNQRDDLQAQVDHLQSTVDSIPDYYKPIPRTPEEKAKAAKDKFQDDKTIIEEAEIGDPVAKKMVERFADMNFIQKIKKIITND